MKMRPLWTCFGVRLEVGSWEEGPDTANVSTWTHWWCSVGRECSPTRKCVHRWTHFCVGLEEGVWLTRGCQRSGDTAGEGREGCISIKYIVLIYKKEPFMGMGTTAHPHPPRCARVPTWPPLFALLHPSLCCCVRHPFPHTRCQRGILVTPCGVMDVPWVVEEVLGDGGQRGTWLWWV